MVERVVIMSVKRLFFYLKTYEKDSGKGVLIAVYKNLKGFKTKEIALEQMKLLATIQPTF